MTSSFTRNQLKEFYRLLDLEVNSSALKPKLIAGLTDHLAKTPADLSKSDQLKEFFEEQQEAAKSSEGDEESEVPTSAGSLEGSAPEPSILAEVEEVVESDATAISSYLKPTFSSFNSKWLGFQRRLSTIWVANVGLILVEYATVTYKQWPTYFGTLLLDQDTAIEVAQWVGSHFALHALPAFLASLVLNFTKQTSIRRKKHVYTFDPVVFGLAHFLATAVLFTIGVYSEFSGLAAVTGVTSAILGLYTSIGQTP